eukprot:4274080-Pyramimonas_sp.AAC.1
MRCQTCLPFPGGPGNCSRGPRSRARAGRRQTADDLEGEDDVAPACAGPKVIRHHHLPHPLPLPRKEEG